MPIKQSNIKMHLCDACGIHLGSTYKYSNNVTRSYLELVCIALRVTYVIISSKNLKS